MLSTHSSPAVVSAAAAGKLPRWALFALLIAFVLPLFFSNDVWHGRSLTSFGISWTMANGNFSDWLLPNVNGVPAAEVGPLSYWLSALSIVIFGPLLGDVQAYHIAACIWFAMTTASIWYAAYYLSRRDEAQPISFVFGGEAARKDYGRVVADIAVMMTVGTYGLIAAFHELTAVTTLLAFSALALYGIILSLQYLWKGSLIAGTAIGAIALTSSPGIGIWCVLGAWCTIFFTPDYTSRTKRAVITLSAAFVTAFIWPAIVFLIYPSEAADWFRIWISNSVAAFSFLPLADYPNLLKNLIWLTFPLWPLAFWGVYAWRAQLHQAPLAVPLSFFGIALCSILFTGTETDSTILFVIPSLAILSALGIVSLKRSRENFLDLYSGIIYTLAILVTWIYFFAWATGTPRKMAFSLTRLAPAVTDHGTSVFLFFIAVVTTAVWLALVFWRLFKHPLYVWRGALMNGAGLTAVWIVVMCLFVHLIDGARSMRPIVRDTQAVLQVNDYQPGQSVSRWDLSLSDISAFNYWGDIHFSSDPDSDWIIASVPVSCQYIPEELEEDYRLVSIISGRPRSRAHYLLLRSIR